MSKVAARAEPRHVEAGFEIVRRTLRKGREVIFGRSGRGQQRLEELRTLAQNPGSSALSDGDRLAALAGDRWRHAETLRDPLGIEVVRCVPGRNLWLWYRVDGEEIVALRSRRYWGGRGSARRSKLRIVA
jgi:hypothetical protein